MLLVRVLLRCWSFRTTHLQSEAVQLTWMVDEDVLFQAKKGKKKSGKSFLPGVLKMSNIRVEFNNLRYFVHFVFFLYCTISVNKDNELFAM
jgi:hypothetical protein